MAFTVVYDACVLYPASVRDTLIRLANTGLVRARWSNQILDECFRNISADRHDLQPAQLQRTRDLMTQAVPDCMVTGYEPLIEGIELPDPDDRHVVAAAIRCGAQVIVTFNLNDFPSEKLTAYHLEARHPDDFVLDNIDLSPGSVIRALEEQHKSLRNPPVDFEAMLDTLRQRGLVQSVARIRELMY